MAVAHSRVSTLHMLYMLAFMSRMLVGSDSRWINVVKSSSRRRLEGQPDGVDYSAS
jgi:hypothetical protein